MDDFRRFVTFTATIGLVAACVGTEPRGLPVMKGPDGHLWIPLRCNDEMQCLTHAAFFCPEGYRVADHEGHVEASFSAGSFRGTGFAHGESEYKGTMLVQCTSCEVDRRFQVDGEGHFQKDPTRSDVVKLCAAE